MTDYLVTSDLHLSDKPRDKYRFGLFDWLYAQQKIHKPRATFILGDLTEAKDRHSSSLVNQIVDGLTSLEPPVFILRGNHDGLDQSTPFFKFINNMDGISFICSHTQVPLLDYRISMIPHQLSQVELDIECRRIQPGWGVFLHNTFQGVIAETGAVMSGLSASLIAEAKPRWCWAGDVHKPQQCGPVAYVGSPYAVRFGDDFTPRVLLLDDSGATKDLHFPAPKKAVLKIRDAGEIEGMGLVKGDQVKVTLELTREEVVQWASHKEHVLAACRNLGLEVYGVELQVAANKRERIKLKVPTGKTPEEYFKGFCVAEQVPAQMKATGLKFLGGVK